jgi:hypothetical protein
MWELSVNPFTGDTAAVGAEILNPSTCAQPLMVIASMLDCI